MNYLWAFMILTGAVFAAFHGTLPAVTQAALDSAKEAVTLCITMMGVMSFWVGLMKIAEKTGIIAGLSRRLAPVLHFLFPDIPKDHPANKYIATNMIANIFGLGGGAGRGGGGGGGGAGGGGGRAWKESILRWHSKKRGADRQQRDV